jgi:HK97 family phage prohead protease
MSIPEKYSHIDFKPPSGVKREAEYGLKLRREHGRGGTAVGIARARDLANGVQLSPSTIRRMKAFFDRHQSDEKAEGFNRGDKNYPSNGLIANKLWGGPSGYSYAKKVVEQMNAADEKEGRALRPFGSTQGIKPKVFVVHGPPASGKTSYVMQNKGENDVVFDFDKVMSALSGLPPHQKNSNLISYCTDIRTLIIEKALRSPKVDKTWIISTNVGDDMKGQLSDIPVEYIHIDTPKEECLKRIEEDPERQPVAEELRQVVERYFETKPDEQRSAPVQPNVERRFLGNFSHADTQDPDLLKVERRADPATGKPQTYVVGYAARFGKDSLLMGDFVERIDPAAFDLVESRTDSEGRPLETRCLFNHDPNHLLGRFPTTMKMYVDEKGLRYECSLPESRSDIAESIARGDLKGSSFSFVVADGGEKWTYENGRSMRLVTKIKSLLDCGPVTYPAYGDATVAVAKRSYQQFVAEKSSRSESRNATKAKAAEELAKTREFLESRAFCKTGAGGGVDNSCGKEGNPSGGKESETKKNIAKAAKKEKGYEAKRKGSFADRGARIGAAVGMAVGLVGGLTGAAIGGVIGGFGGGYLGMMIPNPNKTGVVKAWKPFAKKKSSRSDAGTSSVEELAASLGVDDEAIKSAIATAADSDTAKGGVAATDKGSLVITVSGLSSFMVLSPGNPWLNQQSLSLFVGSPDSVDRVRLCEIAAASLGAKSIAVGKASPGVVAELLKAGYKQATDGVVVKDVASEKRAFCPKGEGEGIDNSCSSAGGGGKAAASTKEKSSGKKTDDETSGTAAGPKDSKYMEWDKTKDNKSPTKTAKAQDFLDKAREEQMSKGGKAEGMADEGGGVQTWSKGDTFPWTPKQVGTDEGYVQGLHPDGSKTEKYPFSGGKSAEAFKKMGDEIKRKKGKRSHDPRQVARDTIEFLKARRA